MGENEVSPLKQLVIALTIGIATATAACLCHEIKLDGSYPNDTVKEKEKHIQEKYIQISLALSEIYKKRN